MNLVGYWAATLLIDIWRCLVPCMLSVALMYAFGLDYPDTWPLFILYPFSLVPFTYCTSYLFSKESTAQSITIFIHFFVGGLLAIATSVLRIIEQTWSVGDTLNWFLRIVPSFPLSNAIMFSSTKDQIYY